MTLPQQTDAAHKAWLSRILTEIADDPFLPTILYFKGGTCASMLGWLDRFSVDLDFDYAGNKQDIAAVRVALERLWASLGLEVRDASKRGIQYFLRYDGQGRNTIKIDTSFPLLDANTYAPRRLQDIDRILTCQTIETMFAHKLLAIMGRHNARGTIAGRDVYDIHFFFLRGYRYSHEVLREGSGRTPADFFATLSVFVEEHVTEKMLAEDLNYLLPPTQFQRIRKTLKQEVLVMLRDEQKRLSAG